jgi:hypothetical protein
MIHIMTEDRGMTSLSGRTTFLPGLKPAIVGLPSWVLDLSRQTAVKSAVICTEWFAPPDGFKACAPYKADYIEWRERHVEVLGDRRTLRIDALYVDTIDTVFQIGSSWPDCLASLVEIEQIAEAAQSKNIHEHPLKEFMDHVRRRDPLWQTLVCRRKHNWGGAQPAPMAYEGMFEELLDACRQGRSPSEPNSEYVLSMRERLPGRALITTTYGFVGLANPEVEVGDEVMIWSGARMPYVMRPSTERPGTFGLVSAAYVGGVSRGEFVEEMLVRQGGDWARLLVR